MNAPGAKVGVIRNNNSVKGNLDDMNSFPLDLRLTNQLGKKQLHPRDSLAVWEVGRVGNVEVTNQ